MGFVRKVAVVKVALLGAGLLWARRNRDWGATAEECALVLPGDELIDDPAVQTTRAVTVDAPVGEVWPWLVQIGQDRGGMYSYDWLENLIGLDIHSADRVHPEWQHPELGHQVVLMRPGYLGMREGYSLPIARVEPGVALVLRQQPPQHPWDGVWSFVLLPVDDRRCRLLSRTRTNRPAGASGPLTRITDAVADPIILVMTRRMLLGIKERAEHR